MPKLPNGVLFAVLLMLSGTASAEDIAKAAKDGATAYRLCAACHSLQPGVHLSGPSLSGLWGKPAASNESYGRYTQALKKEKMIWDENTLNAWLADPQALVPGTTMALRGIEDDATRGNLIAFLREAMAEGGAETVVKAGLIPESMAEGQLPPDLSSSGPDQRVKAIRHCRDAFYVTKTDGTELPFWETNVRIKIDASARGPGDGQPVLLRSGMVGDRVSVVFSSLSQIQKLLSEQC